HPSDSGRGDSNERQNPCSERLRPQLKRHPSTRAEPGGERGGIQHLHFVCAAKVWSGCLQPFCTQALAGQVCKLLGNAAVLGRGGLACQLVEPLSRFLVPLGKQGASRGRELSSISR